MKYNKPCFFPRPISNKFFILVTAMKNKKLSNPKSEDWLKLCHYVKIEILGYDNSMKFPKFLALRLQGLSRGQFIANKNQQSSANYDFKIILETFKKLKIKILNLTQNKKFKNEFSKINYIMAIVENEINDVVLAEKSKHSPLSINLKLFKPLKKDSYKTFNSSKTKGDRTFNEVTKWMW